MPMIASANGSSVAKKHFAASPHEPEPITSGSGVVVALHFGDESNGDASVAGVVHPVSQAHEQLELHCI